MYAFNEETLEIVACGRPSSSDLEEMKQNMDKNKPHWAIFDFGSQIAFIVYNPDSANGTEKGKILFQREKFLSRLS